MNLETANPNQVEITRPQASAAGSESAPVLSIKTGRKIDPAVAERRREDRETR